MYNYAIKESLNSDGQHFHQYQQNAQLHLIFPHWTQRKATTYDRFGGVKLVNGNTTFVQYRYKQNDIIYIIDNTTDKIRLENLWGHNANYRNYIILNDDIFLEMNVSSTYSI
jgi:hypothetical protein